MNGIGSAARDRTHVRASASATGSQSGEPRVLLVPDGLIPTTYIIEPVLRHALGSRFAGLRLAADLDGATLQREALLFSRVCDPRHGWLPGWLSRRGARYAYFLDDNLWAFRSDSDVGRYYARRDVLATLDRFIRNAACVLVSSWPLRDALIARFGDIDVRHVTAPFDFSLVDRDAPSRASVLRVGYAGSERGEAFAPVTEAIERVLHSHRGAVEFEFIGYVPPALVGRSGVTVFPAITNYAEFLAFKQWRGWHVGLAPLNDDAFNRAKTNNKFREYGALGIAGVYSRVEPYVSSVINDGNGLLVAHSPDAWASALVRLIEEPGLKGELGLEARRHVWNFHRLDAAAGSWCSLLGDVGLTPAKDGRLSRMSAWIASARSKLGTRLHAQHRLLAEIGPARYLRRLVSRARIKAFNSN